MTIKNMSIFRVTPHTVLVDTPLTLSSSIPCRASCNRFTSLDTGTWLRLSTWQQHSARQYATSGQHNRGSPQILLDKIQRVINCSACLIFKVPKSAQITPFLYDLHWLPNSGRIQYKIALICFHIVSGTAPHTSLRYFISTLLLALFAQLQILASSMFLEWAGGPWGRDLFNTLDLCSGTPFLSLSGICLHSLLVSRNWKLSLLLCILICHFTNSYMYLWCVCVWGGGGGLHTCVCVCVCDEMSVSLYFVSTLSSYKMGHHKIDYY